MKICRFNDNRLGVVKGELLFDVTSVLNEVPSIKAWPLPPGDWFIANLARLRPLIEAAAASAPSHGLDDVALLSPVANPGKIIGAPVNYHAHHAEAVADKAINFGADVKTIETYGLFLKANSALVGPAHGVTLNLTDRRHDHEGEMVVVIGREARNLDPANALDAVAGYCCGLDMTARGSEDRSLRKSLDSYAVLGPYLVTADEIADPDALRIHLTVNGKTRQDASTSLMIHNTRKLVAYASRFYTLYPGDVIMTGTPAGVGPVVPGDMIGLAIDGLGSMRVAVR